jgi:hypothetical protein
MTRKLILAIAVVTVVTGSWVAWFALRAGPARAERVPNGLLTSNRTDFRVCVSVPPWADSTQLEAAAHSVAIELDNIHHDSGAWGALDIGSTSTRVVSGCPDGWIHPSGSIGPKSIVGRGTVSEPTEYRTMVFVVSDKELSEQPYQRAAYELLCSGDSCGEVTTALFVTTSTVNSGTALNSALRVGIGLGPIADGRYPSGHPDSEKSTK